MSEEYRPRTHGVPATDWLPIFLKAKVESERLEAAKSERSKTTLIGNFLSRLIDRTVQIEVDGRTGRATLRSAPGRSGKKLYYFEIEWDEPETEKEKDSGKPAPGSQFKPEKRSTRRRQVTQPSRANDSRCLPIKKVAAGPKIGGNNETW